MRILLCNDDGIDAPGLTLLADSAARLGAELWTVAPSRKWTAASHQLSFDADLALEPRGERRYACSGAPADCIVAAMTLLFQDARPDLVLSGINDGENIGEDAIYSGTLAAAREATLWGIPAIGLSRPKKSPAAPEDAGHIARLIATLHERRALWAADRSFLSVNLPARLPAPLATAAPGHAKIGSAIERLDDGQRGATRFRLSRKRSVGEAAGDQAHALTAGNVVVLRLSALGLAPLDSDVLNEA